MALSKKRHSTRWGISLVGLLLAALSFYALYDLGFLRFVYPSHRRFPVRGIDVSHHQKEIEWDRVKRAGVMFAYIKATEGSDFTDSTFFKNWQEAHRAGFACGAYHFFTFGSSGQAQAAHFLGTVPSTDSMLPPVIDLEFGGNTRARPSKENLQKELDDFIRAVTETWDLQPVLYVTREAYDAYISGEEKYSRLWMRDLFKTPPSGRNAWMFWQFANRARVPGIPTPVDLNIFQGSAEALALLQVTPRRQAHRQELPAVSKASNVR